MNTEDRIDEWIKSQRKSMLKVWKDLVSIDSGSEDKEGISEVANIIKEELLKDNLKIKEYRFDKAGPTIVASMEGKKKEKIILLGHMDTVFAKGSAANREFKIEGEKAYGPGVLDMKGGIVQILYTVRALNYIKWNDYTLQVILVGDEEVGHQESSVLDIIQKEAEDAVAVFCCESGRLDNKAVIGRKGITTIVLETKGKAAHSGNAIKMGANAIIELSYKLLQIQKLEILDDETTVNVGNIKGGGAVNVVPDYARAELDVRFFDENKLKRLISEIDEICHEVKVLGTATKMKYVIEYPSMKPNECNHKLLDLINKVSMKLLGQPVEGCIVGGGADSSHFAKLQIPTVCALGVRGEANHTAEEYAEVESLFSRTRLLIETIRSFIL